MNSNRLQPDHTSREWLYQKYVVEDMGMPAIAKIAGCNSTTILYWLRKHDIATRPVGVRSKNVRATEFKSGFRPTNKMPVGSRTVREDKNGTPRSWIKVAEPNRWILLAVFVWESHYGPVPKGYVLHHLDGNSLNDTIDNLRPVTRRQHIKLHHSDLRGAMPALTHEKTKTCPDCGRTWTGRGRRVARCAACKHVADSRFKRAYKLRKSTNGHHAAEPEVA